MIRKYFLILAVTASSMVGYAQNSFDDRAKAYIEKYKDLAMKEQIRTGVPASIKLAQGIYETGAGTSELCNNASNHFGIKCKTSWVGETYLHTDDAKDECFRKYASAEVSFKDHSDFLRSNKRYSSLFEIAPTDYTSWAYGLKRCGYATNPAYAKKIIKTIEDYQLNEHTYAALNRVGEKEVLYASAQTQDLPKVKTATSSLPGEHIPNEPSYNQATTSNSTSFVAKPYKQEKTLQANVTDYYVVTSKNGKKGFYGKKGDLLLEQAIKNKIRYSKLLEMNDLADAPLDSDMFIYLEHKARIGSNATHTVVDGETLSQISQEEGVMLKQLRAYNLLAKGEEPTVGTVLNLQSTAMAKPEMVTYTKQEAPDNTYATKATKAAETAYIPTKKTTYSTPEHIVEQPKKATKEEVVNIANETPVEETIAAQNATKSGDAKVSPLDKLKAHMDKTVYANDKTFEPKSSKNYDDDNTDYYEETVSLPARKVNNPTSAKPVEKKVVEKKTSKEKAVVAAKAKSKSHTVKKGESLFSIASKYDLTVAELQKANKLGKAKVITPGMKLKVSK